MKEIPAAKRWSAYGGWSGTGAGEKAVGTASLRAVLFFGKNGFIAASAREGEKWGPVLTRGRAAPRPFREAGRRTAVPQRILPGPPPFVRFVAANHFFPSE
ncbi:MAG: hypothetical protein C6P37_08580 [Caldibacillus debilis]|uniref:Uncharacterized protein n=1 Tax=Caldibacillus debilis TaxID=301148 RepID=A0A3E0K4T1_9BACI|nr:MAG: hypothetical protein C6P37_08580 [Caldibacillus debilis]